MDKEEVVKEKISLNTAREIAARIWCDQDFSHVIMDVDMCEAIAHILLVVARDQGK